MGSQPKDFHVLVIGGGLAGLSIAHGLQKNGISYTIFDRETTPRDRNWGVTLGWAHPLLQQLLPEKLFANLSACQPDPSLDTKAANKECVLIRDGATGETMVEPHFPGIRRVNIRKTKNTWREGLNIQYGKKLIDISTSDDGASVTAHFEDGTRSTGSIIMGADGGASHVRKWLLGDLAAQEVLPFTFMNFAFSLTASQALWLDSVMNPNVDVAPHPKSMYLGLFLLDKPDLSKPESWVFYLLVTWPSDDPEEASLAGLRRKMEGWADPYKSAVEWLPDDVVIKPEQLRIWHPKPWDSRGGRVTLSGDAAHSMTFHRGQGGNLAIKDAMEFVGACRAIRAGEKTREEAMAVYDAGVVERGEEVEISKRQAEMFHDYDNFRESPVFKMGIKPNSAK